MKKHILLLAAVAGLAAGCNQNSDLDSFIEEQRSAPAKPIEPLPLTRARETFVYNKTGVETSPFDEKKPVAAAIINGPKPIERPRQDLERFDLDSLKMVGTVGPDGKRAGLIMGPDGIVRKVFPGMYLGKSEGRITAISAERIDMIELVASGEGWQEREASISLE